MIHGTQIIIFLLSNNDNNKLLASHILVLEARIFQPSKQLNPNTSIRKFYKNVSARVRHYITTDENSLNIYIV